MALIRDTDAPPNPGVAAGATLGAGLAAGLVGGIVMLVILGAGAELAAETTEKPSVETSLVTVPNAITSFTFDTGLEQFDDGYTWATYPGIGLMLIAAIGFALVGVALIAAILGRYPDLAGGVFVGLLFGVLLQLVVLDWIVDGLQDVDTLHSAAPAWSWWAGHLAFGLAVGLLGTTVLRRSSRLGDLMSAEV